MSATVLYMSMSFDGFIAGPNEGPGNRLGDGGHRLHEWALTGADADREASLARVAGVNGQVVGQGRRLFDNLRPEQIDWESARLAPKRTFDGIVREFRDA